MGRFDGAPHVVVEHRPNALRLSTFERLGEPAI
jgi:hypothetical protein